MDDEMIDRLTPILLKHNPQTKIGATIVLVELLQAMREPTEKMWKTKQPIWSLGRPMWDWWRSMIDVITND